MFVFRGFDFISPTFLTRMCVLNGIDVVMQAGLGIRMEQSQVD